MPKSLKSCLVCYTSNISKTSMYHFLEGSIKPHKRVICVWSRSMVAPNISNTSMYHFLEGSIKPQKMVICVCSRSMVAPLTQEHFTFPKEGRLESYLCQIKGMEPQVKSDTHALTLKQNQGKGFEKQDL